MPVNCFKYLSLFLSGGGAGGRRRDEEKPYISVSSSVGLDAYRVFLVTFISAAYITEQQHNNGVAVARLRLCVQYVWNKKGKLFSQAVLCFILGVTDPIAAHTALSLPVGTAAFTVPAVAETELWES